jgi:uncharacterized Ntn-hydrolase superfamily protein
MNLLRQGTYSIVAHDAATGQVGVAVQSHWFSVGSAVTWARPGVGAVATQANLEVSYGPLLLDALERGEPPQSALAALLDQDELASSRQVAVVSAQAEVAVHTGEECIVYAGHRAGRGVCCQANIMANPRVWPRMFEAYEAAAGSLAERLLVALEAAEEAGGDLRGRQSAALLVVPAGGRPWDTVVSLRVEDHPEPLVELRRLARLHDAYRLANEGDERAAAGRHEEAAQLFEQASALAPDKPELLFWAGLGAAQSGRLAAGVEKVRAAVDQHPPWQELLERLPADVAPAARPVREALARP